MSQEDSESGEDVEVNPRLIVNEEERVIWDILHKSGRRVQDDLFEPKIPVGKAIADKPGGNRGSTTGLTKELFRASGIGIPTFHETPSAVYRGGPPYRDAPGGAVIRSGGPPRSRRACRVLGSSFPSNPGPRHALRYPFPCNPGPRHALRYPFPCNPGSSVAGSRIPEH